MSATSTVLEIYGSEAGDTGQLQRAITQAWQSAMELKHHEQKQKDMKDKTNSKKSEGDVKVKVKVKSDLVSESKLKSICDKIKEESAMERGNDQESKSTQGAVTVTVSRAKEGRRKKGNSIFWTRVVNLQPTDSSLEIDHETTSRILLNVVKHLMEHTGVSYMGVEEPGQEAMSSSPV